MLRVEIKVHYVNADTGEQGRRAPVILARSHDDRHLPLNADDTTTQGQGMCSVQTAKLKEAKTFAYSTPPIYRKIRGMLHIKGKDRRSTMTSAEEEQKKKISRCFCHLCQTIDYQAATIAAASNLFLFNYSRIQHQKPPPQAYIQPLPQSPQQQGNTHTHRVCICVSLCVCLSMYICVNMKVVSLMHSSVWTDL